MISSLPAKYVSAQSGKLSACMQPLLPSQSAPLVAPLNFALSLWDIRPQIFVSCELLQIHT